MAYPVAISTAGAQERERERKGSVREQKYAHTSKAGAANYGLGIGHDSKWPLHQKQGKQCLDCVSLLFLCVVAQGPPGSPSAHWLCCR